MRLLAIWLINAIALLSLPFLTSSVQIANLGTALVVALALGLINTLIRPILILLTLPVTMLSLGLFILLINGALFYAVAHWVEGFHVAGFWSAVFASLLYSVISWALTTLVFEK